LPPKVDERAELLKLIQELEQEREAYSKMQEVNRFSSSDRTGPWRVTLP